MKKVLSLILVISSFQLFSQTPVTLTESMPFGPQTFHTVSGSITGLVLPTMGSNQFWNYSGLVPTSTYSFGFVAASNTAFPDAGFADTSIAINFISGTVYYSDYYYKVGATGYLALGNEIFKQDYNISTTTGGAGDSCKIPLQQNIFQTPYPLIAFPATMNSAWTSAYSNNVDFSLSIAAYGLSNVPCYRVSHITRLDTVVGWGKLRLPLPGGPSKDYECLMVQRTVIQKDSFYMAGTPAPAPMLTAFGLSQGMTTPSYRYLFWRPESAYPLMGINFGTNNFTTPTGVFWDGDAQDPNSLNYLARNLQVFPNPSNGHITVQDFPNGDLEVVSLTGQVLRRIHIQSLDQQVDVGDLEPGQYLIRFTNQDTRYTGKLHIVN